MSPEEIPIAILILYFFKEFIIKKELEIAFEVSFNEQKFKPNKILINKPSFVLFIKNIFPEVKKIIFCYYY